MVSFRVITGLGSQSSVAVMSVPMIGAVGIASHSTTSSAGMPAKTGACVSSTVIVCVTVTTFPHASSAVHSLKILWSPAHAPDVIVSFKVIVGFVSQLSIAVISVPITGGVGTLLQSIVISAGTPESVGACVSSTVIVCVSVTAFPHASSAVHSLVKI